MKKTFHAFIRFAGISSNKTSHREKIISSLGGFISIFLILIITRQFVVLGDAGLIVASLGASAVLLFAVPHGPMSQPWALSCGHLVSAAIGVTCYLMIPNLFIAAAAAVGLAIATMYYMRCIHPPGGATALTAVVAGSEVHTLAYQYIVTPVLINISVIFVVAFLFNFLFPWRRYPMAMMQYSSQNTERQTPAAEGPAPDDLEYALQQMNLYIDISHEDLERIYHLARNRANEQPCLEIKVGHYYSNGEYGKNWSVRQIVDESDNPRPDRDQIIYKVIAGKNRRHSATISRDEFIQWAKYEVYLNENSWQRVISPSAE
jgi:CBS domain-containing membrane protein